MTIDGKKMAEEILARTKERASALSHPPVVVAIVGSDTPATRSYLKIKEKYAVAAGCIFEVIAVNPEMLDVLMIRRSSKDKDAIIIQLPLPEQLDMKALCDVIPLSKDVDVLSSTARERFARGATDALLPPVVAVVKAIFQKYEINAKDKKTVVIGEGWLVGAPAAVWLKQQGAEVVVANSKTEDLTALLRRADIIVSGAGVPGLIKPEMLKQGVVLIDAATSESNGVIAGDADPACASKCSLFTPVPGGVGPIAVACLFENAVTLAERVQDILEQ